MQFLCKKLGLIVIMKKINGHKLLHHGLKNISSSLIERGVAIIIYPSLYDDYKETGEFPLLISSSSNEVNSRRFMLLSLMTKSQFKFKKSDFRSKKVKVFTLNVTLLSIYYLVDQHEH